MQRPKDLALGVRAVLEADVVVVDSSSDDRVPPVAEGHLGGAPQLVVEIAASSVSYDLHDKKEAYRRNQVREYIVWRVLDQAIDWFRLEAGEYARVEPDERGVIESTTFPGLRLNVPKMLTGDLAGVLAELDQSPT